MTSSTEDLEQALGVLIQLASGNYSARGTPSGADEEYEALMLGVNMLAEELEASRGELEQRVRERTDELRQLNDDMRALSELGRELRGCVGTEEALQVISAEFPTILAPASGTLYVHSIDHERLERVTAWGPHAPTEPSLCRHECRALDPGSDRGDQRVTDCEHGSSSSGVGEGDAICIPLAAGEKLLGLLRLRDVGPPPGTVRRAGQSLHQLATTAVEQASLALLSLEMSEELQAQAMRDPLTSLYNRRFMDEWVRGELSRTDRAETSLGVIMVDIDRFKEVNDTFGHDAGDHVLRAVAATLRSSLRPEDIACRYGGEEFVLLLSGISAETLTTRAEVLRARVSDLRIEHDGVLLPQVNVSAGFALYPQHGTHFNAVLGAADEALYRAKQSGRNRALSA
ncbi:MAG: diguanylate cyclase [Nocardioidaceae bacterium]